MENQTNFPKWNWGAFLFNWIWGIGNNTYIAFLMFIPIVNIIMPFILGINGYKWAWKNKHWVNEDEFLKNQKDWTKWGLIVVGGMILFFTIIFTSVFGTISKNEPFVSAVEIIQNDPLCEEYLGKDLKKGFGWTGSVNTSGSSGDADVSFTIKGSKSTGKCFLVAHTEYDEWIIDLLFVRDKTTEEKIILIDNR